MLETTLIIVATVVIGYQLYFWYNMVFVIPKVKQLYLRLPFSTKKWTVTFGMYNEWNKGYEKGYQDGLDECSCNDVTVVDLVRRSLDEQNYELANMLTQELIKL